MRLFLRDAVPGQKVNNRLGLDLEFAGQFVDADLVCFAHASYGPFHGQKFHRLRLRRVQLLVTFVALPLSFPRLRNVPVTAFLHLLPT